MRRPRFASSMRSGKTRASRVRTERSCKSSVASATRKPTPAACGATNAIERYHRLVRALLLAILASCATQRPSPGPPAATPSVVEPPSSAHVELDRASRARLSEPNDEVKSSHTPEPCTPDGERRADAGFEQARRAAM